MKKLFPIILSVLLFSMGIKLYSSGAMTPTVLIGFSLVVMVFALTLRPKANGKHADPKVITDALGEFGKDAFSDDSKLSQDFRAAVDSLLTNMPKACLAKLEKLGPQCTNDAQRYALAIVKGITYTRLNMHDKAIPEYNQAVVIHPTSAVAYSIGSCQQRLGQLEKAIDSYEFSLELDPQNIQARSALATAWVADRNYKKALTQAELALMQDETNASSLATSAICHGLLGNDDMRSEYTEKAVSQGYDRKKIDETIKALKN